VAPTLSTYVNIPGATNTTLFDSGLSPNTQYSYRVVVTDSSGYSVNSSGVGITTLDPLVLGTLSAADITSGSIQLTAPNATGGLAPYIYRWFKSLTSGFTPGPGTEIVGQTAQSFTDTGLLPNTTYYYICTVWDATGDGLADAQGDQSSSPQLAVTTALQALAIGSISIQGVSGTTATLSCPQASGGHPGYTYSWYRSQTPGFSPGSSSLIASNAGTNLNDTALSAGETYYYVVVCTDSSGTTAQTPQLTVLTPVANALVDYYANLLIIQYLGQPKAYATIQALAEIATLSSSSTSTADTQLPLAVQNGFNLGTAQGVQLDILGKYAGVTRKNGNTTLSDSDFRRLIQAAIGLNGMGSDLASIQNFIAQFFPGDLLVVDNANMTFEYYVNSATLSANLINALIAEGLLPRPMGVQITPLITAPNITQIFDLRNYEAPAPTLSKGFNSYSGYNASTCWLSYGNIRAN
jgi:fibronectin type 3 domain-containing protein